ncbi:TonB-dependent receptor plug domain-containing protein [Pelagicoccus sp. NFK12]|uniref:TonB-dependent receptor plug domain-containing protein n=1 Tax=Pelagicoccus enzymogenes TaxID=2773457 RepID=A0A927FCI4_9BACT|nr:TonB-dependent receptor plug domain-containing protein [Pelagicoccus enzymogenes]MBD5782334.1 TonB-dependent receptor plug domain-containing protein [Pelagicoccus enzymogenes]
MKKYYKTKPWLAASLVVAAPCFSLYGQAGGEQDEDENVFTLSPFQVDGSRDEGYRAESATAGSRLNTELKDVAASVSVLTEAFMDDLGATDLVTALEQVAGAETNALTDRTSDRIVGGDGYSGNDFGDPRSSEGSIRVRGLGDASKTQGFLPVIIGGDRYNIERAEFLRGPNSILFGLGQPGGLINYAAKTAHTGQDINNVSFVTDNFGTLRGTFDASRVLMEDKLAVRLAGKWGNQQYNVEHARELDRRAFATFTYRPTQNTTITGFYENIDRYSRQPGYRPVHDNVSGWLSVYNDFYAQQVSNGLSGAALEQSLFDAGFWWDPTDPGVRNSNGTQNMDTVRRATGVIGATSDIDGVGTGVSAGEVRLGDDWDGQDNALLIYYDGNAPDTPLFGGMNLAGTRLPDGGRGPNAERRTLIRTAHPLENRSGFLDPQVTDSGIFPYHKFDLNALPGNYRDEEDEKIGFTLEHKVNDNFYVGVSGMKEDYAAELNFPIIAQTQAIQLDNNRYMLFLDANGEKVENPNFLRPFIYGRPLGLYRERATEGYQAQANYDLDFSDINERLSWLGKHRLTGVYTYGWQENFEYRWETRANNTVDGVLTSGLRTGREDNFNDAGRRVYNLWYIGDPVQPGDTSLNINSLPSNVLAQEQDIGYNYWTGANTISTSPTAIELRRGSIDRGNYSEQINKGISGSIQSFWWNDRIVTLLGARSDSVYPYVRSTIDSEAFDNSIGRIDPNDPERELFPLDISKAYYSPRGDANNPLEDVSTTTQSVIFHILPDKLRVFANRSENFDVSAPRTDNFGRIIAPQGGETEEVGIGATIMENKLDLRLSFYDTAQVNTSDGGLNFLASISLPGFEENLYSALEEAGRLNEWETYDTNAQLSSAPYQRPENVDATLDSRSKGFEFSGTYNPSPNWRFKFDFSRLENEGSNAGAQIDSWLAARAPYYLPFFQEGLKTDGTLAENILNSDGTAADGTLLRQFFNSVMPRYVTSKLNDGRPNLGISEYTAKLLTNYSFTDGRFKGFSVGGNLIWEDGKALGSNTKDVPVADFVPALGNLPGEDFFATVGDPDATIFGDSILTGGLKIGYRTKINDGRINWNIQLNATRLIDSSNKDGLRVRALNPESVTSDGTVIDNNIYSLAVPTTYMLTNTFSW